MGRRLAMIDSWRAARAGPDRGGGLGRESSSRHPGTKARIPGLFAVPAAACLTGPWLSPSPSTKPLNQGPYTRPHFLRRYHSAIMHAARRSSIGQVFQGEKIHCSRLS